LIVRLPVVDNGISLPLAAVYGADTVYAVVDGRLSPRSVTYVGEHNTPGGEIRAVVVSEELDPGDEVVTTQIPAAVEGLKVTVKEP
jgi:hypothetical protein